LDHLLAAGIESGDPGVAGQRAGRGAVVGEQDHLIFMTKSGTSPGVRDTHLAVRTEDLATAVVLVGTGVVEAGGGTFADEEVVEIVDVGAVVTISPCGEAPGLILPHPQTTTAKKATRDTNLRMTQEYRSLCRVAGRARRRI
jgi:hypothetical protein